MNHHNKPPIGFPETLYDQLSHEDEQDEQKSDIVYRRNHRQGNLTAAVRGSQINITVRLRRGWAMLCDLLHDDQVADFLCRLAKSGDFWCKVSVVAVALYLLFTIGPTLVAILTMPGGAQ